MKTRTTLMITFALGIFLTTSIQAATLKCTVEKIEGSVITMDCGEKSAKLSPGTKVKVKTMKKKSSAIEGC